MASCAKCGANLITQARFCASCGSPVSSGSIAPAPPAPRPAAKAVPDAFARTILSDGDNPLANMPPMPGVSPMAASVMADQKPAPAGRASSMPQGQPPRPAAGAPMPTAAPAPAPAASPAPAPVAAAPVAAAPAAMPQRTSAPPPPAPYPAAAAPYPAAAMPPQMPQPAAAMPYGAAAPAQSHPFAQGSLVLVYWADGNRYPGTVLQVAQHHVMVVFPNGVQQWIDARYVQAGR